MEARNRRFVTARQEGSKLRQTNFATLPADFAAFQDKNYHICGKKMQYLTRSLIFLKAKQMV